MLKKIAIILLVLVPCDVFAIDTLTPTEPADLRVYQRSLISNSVDIVFSGTCTGTDAAVQYRIVTDGTDNAIDGHDWQTLDAASDCAGAGYSGTATGVPAGAWYNVDIRAEGGSPVSNGSNKWAVGDLVVGTGASNFHQAIANSSGTLTPDTMLSIYNACCLEAGVWQEPVGDGIISFGNAIIANTSAPLGIVNFSVGACPLMDASTAHATNWWLNTAAGSPWAALKNDIANWGGSATAMIFTGMEKDSVANANTQAQYETGLTSFITNQVRADVGNASGKAALPVLIVQLKRTDAPDAGGQKVKNAANNVADATALAFMGAYGEDLEQRDTVHLVPASYATLYRRVAQTYLNIFGYESYYRGPRITQADITGANTITATVTHGGGTDLSAGPYSGFSVFWNGSDRGVASAVKVDATTIKITTTNPIAPGARLFYGYGSNPDMSTPVYDNSALTLPMEERQGVIIRTTLTIIGGAVATSTSTDGGTPCYGCDL